MRTDTVQNTRAEQQTGGFSMIDNISLILVIIGAINWGSIGIFGFDFVGALFGGTESILSRIIFAVVGIAGLWTISILFKDKLPAEGGHSHSH